MTKVEADALLDAFLTANKAGQEELWRASHPEAPDGPTVLIVWLMTMKRNSLDFRRFILALAAVDTRCALRMAIYAAIIAHPLWDNYCGKVGKKQRAAPLAAIRAAIACYRDPTVDNRQAAGDAARDAADAARDANANAAYAAGGAAYAAANAANIGRDIGAVVWAAYSATSGATSAARTAREALGNLEIVVDAAIAAIADHYEDQPLEMP